MNFALLSGAGPIARPDPVALGEVNYAVVGAARLEDRIGRLFRAVTIGVLDPVVLMMVSRDVADCGRDEWCRLATGFRLLRERIAYVHDPEPLDLFQTYRKSLDRRAGDCGSMTAAMMTHAAVLGHAVAACTIAQPNPETGLVEWSHVYAVVTTGQPPRRATFDVSENGVPPGWEPQAWRYRARRDWAYPAKRWAEWYFAGADDARLPAVA